MLREASRAAFARAQRLIPGGVNSPARAFGAVGGDPVFLQRGEGPFVWDIDGNRYCDYVGSWGPLILGHSHPEVVASVRDALSRGTSFGAPTEAESDLAEVIVEAVPSVEMVRFVNSGTEATMSAIRLARGITGRDRVIKFSGNYHGHVDSLLVAAGSSAATLGVPNSPGVTPGTAGDTVVANYNDPASLEHALEEHSGQIAAVIFEPVVGNMGVVPPNPEFLAALVEGTRRQNALLIADEVMTGFRVAFGGAQSRFGFEADLTTLGKIVGGGLPVGAYGGREEYMRHVLPAGEVFQAGTLSGNPLATAAGLATLTLLRDAPPYDHLEQLGQRMESGLRTSAIEANLPHHVGRVGSMLTLFFSPDRVDDWPSAERCDTQRFARYFRGLLDRGVMMPCSQYEALFISAAHTEEEIDTTIGAAREVLQGISQGTNGN